MHVFLSMHVSGEQLGCLREATKKKTMEPLNPCTHAAHRRNKCESLKAVMGWSCSIMLNQMVKLLSESFPIMFHEQVASDILYVLKVSR